MIHRGISPPPFKCTDCQIVFIESFEGEFNKNIIFLYTNLTISVEWSNIHNKNHLFQGLDLVHEQ